MKDILKPKKIPKNRAGRNLMKAAGRKLKGAKGLFVVDMLHDNDCPTLDSMNMKDCCCDPEVRINPRESDEPEGF